jgi:hypothetical protein
VTIELHPWNSASSETGSTNAIVRAGMLTGNVIDVETGQPIPDFTVTPGSGLAPDMLLWRSEETVKGTNGVFRIAAAKPGEPSDHYKIEVPGYMPEMIFEPSLLTNNTIQMHRGEFITGRVLDVDGRPLAGIQVALNLVNTVVGLSGTNFNPSSWGQTNWQRSPITTTDAHGEFKLPAGPGRSGLITVSKDGFAFVKLDHFENSKDIQLQPWAKVAGTLASGREPLKGKSVQIYAGVAANGRMGWWNFQTNLVTDSEGHFSYDRVPPGDVQVALVEPGLFISRRISSAPGSTTNLEMSVPPEPWTNRIPRTGDQIVWGPETNGIQSGISVEGLPQSLKAGDTITVNFWLRNRTPNTFYPTNFVCLESALGANLVPWTVPWPYLVQKENSDRSRVRVEPGAELRLKTETVQIPDIPAGTYQLQIQSFYHWAQTNEFAIRSGEISIPIVSSSTASSRGQ